MTPKQWLILPISAVLALGVIACGDDDDDDGGSGGTGGGVSGEIAIDGSSTVFPFAQAAAEQFQTENPDVRITVGQSGTGGGFEKFCAGETDISNASRPIDSEEEVPLCEKDGVTYRELEVAADGIAIVTNPALEVDCLTTDQLKELWQSGSKVKSLSEIDPSLPDAELSLYGPGTDSGTFEFFTETINGEEANSRKDYQPSEDDNVLVQGVQGDEGGLAYFGFSYAEQNKDSLNVVQVDGGKGCVEPSVATIQSGEYAPLSRPLFMYPSEKALEKPEVKAFMDFVLENAQSIAETALIVPADQSAIDKSVTTLGGLLEAGHSAVRAPAGTAVLGGARRRWGEDAIKAFLILCSLISILTTIGILIALLEETIAFFGDVGIVEFFTTSEWSPLFADPQFGVWPLVWGTLQITGIALLVAVPLGLGAAVYLSEYARPRVRKTFKPILEVLAGIPTIVFGYFALTYFTPTVLNDLLGLDVQVFNSWSAGIIMGFMVLPTIASLAEDAMTAVPQSLREGAFGLGASKLQVSVRIVFPAALSGIVAAIVLGVSRAIGETMIVLVAAGQLPNTALDPGEPHETMTAFIAGTAKGDVPTGSIGYETIFAVGTTLFFMTLLMNAIAIRFVRKYRQVYE